MAEDRLYRFLFPGCVFLLSLFTSLSLWPGFEWRALSGFFPVELSLGESSALLAIGGGVIFILIGYVCSEIVLLIPGCWPDEYARVKCYLVEHGIFPSDEDAFGARLGVVTDIRPADVINQSDLLTIYVHKTLSNEAPGLQAYLQRGWSRILIANFSWVALSISAATSFVVIALVPTAMPFVPFLVWAAALTITWLIGRTLERDALQQRARIYCALLHLAS